jgi:hypothetical protein
MGHGQGQSNEALAAHQFVFSPRIVTFAFCLSAAMSVMAMIR